VKAKRPQILDEIRQEKPLQSRTQEALLGLMRTANLVDRQLEALVGSADVSRQQYNVLRILRGAGKEGLPTLDVASRLVEQTPGITRLLDRLEKKEWIRRERCPTDRRQVLCWITPAGLALLDRLEKPLAEFDRRALAMLTAAETRELIRILDKIRRETG
jgi:DNA-binding MarR family transcriptional regulator